MSGAVSWSADAEAQLRQLWADGLLVREICQRLGRSPGAVVAKIDRLGLPSRSRESQSQVMKSKLRVSSAVTHAAKKEPEREGGKGPECATHFADLQVGQCKWPEGERDFLFCARPIKNGTPYCSYHAQRAFTPQNSIALGH